MLLLPLTLCLTTALMVECNPKPPEVSHQSSMNNMTVIEKWIFLEKSLKGAINSLVKMALPMIMENSRSLNVSSQCMREALTLIAGIRNIRLWALKFIDASAKMIDGMLDGAMSSFGAYDQCLNTNALSERFRDKGKVMFQGQYCTILIKPPLPPKPHFYKSEEAMEEFKNLSLRPTAIGEAAKYAQAFYVVSLRLGICVPSGCSLQDLNNLAMMVNEYLGLEAKASRCEVKTEPEFTNGMICVMFAFCLAGLFLLVGTLLDLYSHFYNRGFTNTAVKILLSFSIFTNFQKLANTDTSNESLSCLHGVRFLSISWIVLSHTYYTINYQIFRGLRDLNALARDFAFQVVANGALAVDTFFFMGGLLVCYVTINRVKKENRPINVIMYILHRLWRILPVYAFLVMFLFLLDLLGSGPIWHDTIDHFVRDCKNNWWTNLIFINNFYNANQMCVHQYWYIASDFQLYIAALIILLPLIKWPKVGIVLSILGVIASMAYAGITTYINKFPATVLAVHADPIQTMNYWASFYFKPFIHAGPYCIGLLAGYLIATRPNLKIPKIVLGLGWSFAICFNMSVLYGVWEWNKGVDPTFFETMFYSSCSRVAWSFGVAWMVVCCCLGHGGVVNYILSWKCWVPLGRLTFTLYLTHPIVQIVIMGNIRTELQPSHFVFVWLFFGHLCVSTGCAFAASMLIEAPFLSLEKIIFSSKVREVKSRVTDSSHLKGTLRVDKGGDIAVMISDTIADELKEHDDNYVSKL